MHESIIGNFIKFSFSTAFTFWKYKCKKDVCLTLFLYYFCNIFLAFNSYFKCLQLLKIF